MPLIPLKGVVLNADLEDVIAKVSPHIKDALYVTSGVRMPYDQLRIIRLYGRRLKLPEMDDFDSFYLKKALITETVQYAPSPLTDLAVMLDHIYWWQMTWSRCLNRGVIVNPPAHAVCLLHSFRSDGSDRLGDIIYPSPHFFGRAFDVGGGKNYSPHDEYATLLPFVQSSPNEAETPSIRGLLLERQNNCVHVDIWPRP